MPDIKDNAMKKKILLAILNIAAAALIGIIIGIYIKYLHPGEKSGGSSLTEKIEALAGNANARIGLAAVFPDGSIMTYSNSRAADTVPGMPERAYPMLSVMKFHQALAVCGWLKANGAGLDDKITVTADELKRNTWSPLRDEHPEGGEFSWRELMEYTLVCSDNNACDILFDRTGGPQYTDSYIRASGARGFRIECTEDMMHENPENAFRNWSTPESAAVLMDRFYKCRDNDAFSNFIWNTMAGCKTGLNRIPLHISEKAAVIAHKTGTGDTGPDGRIMAVNDIGTVVLPDGRHFSLAVFVSDAGCTMEECEEIIAGIAEAVFDFCS